MEETNDDVILAIKDEYEKKLEEQKAELQKEKEDALKEAEQRHIAQIRALMSGRNETPATPTKQEETELSFEEETLKELRNKFKL